MSFEDRAKAIVDGFKENPRNKVFVDFETLRLAASEETGNDVSDNTLKEVIQAYLQGECDGDQETVYDGAVYACGYMARHCLGQDPDEDIDYEIEWISEDDGTFTAQVMLS